MSSGKDYWATSITSFIRISEIPKFISPDNVRTSVSALVHFEVVAATEALGAVWTLVVPLSSVDQLMALQVAGVCKHQIALVALVWFLLRVGPRVRC